MASPSVGATTNNVAQVKKQLGTPDTKIITMSGKDATLGNTTFFDEYFTSDRKYKGSSYDVMENGKVVSTTIERLKADGSGFEMCFDLDGNGELEDCTDSPRKSPLGTIGNITSRLRKLPNTYTTTIGSKDTEAKLETFYIKGTKTPIGSVYSAKDDKGNPTYNSVTLGNMLCKDKDGQGVINECKLKLPNKNWLVFDGKRTPYTMPGSLAD